MAIPALHAFHINPDGIEGTQLRFRVLDANAEAGRLFRAFQVDAKTGELVEVGTALGNPDGSISSNDGLTLTTLTTLVLVPADHPPTDKKLACYGVGFGLSARG